MERKCLNKNASDHQERPRGFDSHIYTNSHQCGTLPTTYKIVFQAVKDLVKDLPGRVVKCD